MLKRAALILALVAALAACTPGSSPSVTVPSSFEAPSLDASPSGSDMTESESPSGSDEESPSGSDEEESESPSSS
jgi:hypothetical protein